ncbi:MAG: T9SS type A sorting domain-containing protein, partial [Flavobacteriales bacterium]|nr:T9SS type A sorting domain-containing protein [Flavobacteriales bacterium]
FQNNAEFIEEYLWSVNGQMAGGDSLFQFVFESGLTTISLQVSNPICSVSDSLLFEVNDVDVDAGDDLIICAGEEIELFAESEFPVLWSNGVGNEIIVVSPIETTMYEVTATDALGCTGSDEVTVVVLENLESSFTIDGNLLSANAGTQFQWFLNGEPILLATNQTLSIDADGLYSVLVLNEEGCGTLSGEVFVSYVHVLDHEIGSFSLYPNPANDQVTMILPASKSDVRIYNNAGQLVFNTISLMGNLNVDVSQWPAGVYQAFVLTNDGLFFKEKLLIQK